MAVTIGVGGREAQGEAKEERPPAAAAAREKEGEGFGD